MAFKEVHAGLSWSFQQGRKNNSIPDNTAHFKDMLKILCEPVLLFFECLSHLSPSKATVKPRINV